MEHAKHVIRVEASPERVWSVISDPMRAPEWTYGVRKVEFVTDQRRGVGAQWRETAVLGPIVQTRLMEVTREDAPRELVLESGSRPHAELTARLESVEAGAATRVSLALEYEMPLGAAGRLVEPALGEWFGAAVLRRSAERLKRLVEREGGEPGKPGPGRAAEGDAATQG